MIEPLGRWALRVRKSKVAASTGWLLVGYAARLGFQAAVFVLVARTLGAESFGGFAAALALANLLSPFVDLGAYSLIIRDVVAGIPTRRAVGNTLMLSLSVSPIALVALVVARGLFVPQVPLLVALALGVSTFLGSRMITTFRGVWVAHGRFANTATLEIMIGVSQLASVMLLRFLHGGLAMYGWLYALQSLAVGGSGTFWLMHRWGRPTWVWKEVRERAVDGFHFATGLAAQTGYTEIDKAVLARVAGLGPTGIFTAAQRLVAVAFVPLMALTGAVYTSFFSAAAAGGLKAARRLAWRMTPITAAYGACGALALWLMAPYLPVILGEQYRASTGALRALAPVMLAQAVAYPFADALTGAGLQSIRTGIQIVTLILNATLNFALDRKFGWQGAVAATLISQSVALCCLIGVGMLRTTLAKSRGALVTSPIDAPAPSRGSPGASG